MDVPLVLPFSTLVVILLLSSGAITAEVEATNVPEEAVLTLDAGNFSEVVAKHKFIVIEFYAPWCGHCKQLALEYEKAASVLRKHDPPVVLAKVDAYNESNKELKEKYKVNAYPAIKIIRNGGSDVSAYGGPRDADGIVEYLVKQTMNAAVTMRQLPAARMKTLCDITNLRRTLAAAAEEQERSRCTVPKAWR